MKKKLCLLLLCLCLASSTACGNNVKSDDSPQKENAVTTQKKNAKVNVDNLDEIVTEDVEKTITSLREEADTLIAEIDTYDKYLENVDKIDAFYKKIYEENKLLCNRLREYSLSCVNGIMASNKSKEDKSDDLEELFDCIYDDAADEIYDEILEGIFEDLHKAFYNGILDDAFDSISYDEWADIYDAEYERWSDVSSDAYDDWSDFRSDVYDLYSDIDRALWRDKPEKAEKAIADFKATIEKNKE